jgi:hypothetical protein
MLDWDQLVIVLILYGSQCTSEGKNGSQHDLCINWKLFYLRRSQSIQGAWEVDGCGGKGTWDVVAMIDGHED